MLIALGLSFEAPLLSFFLAKLGWLKPDFFRNRWRHALLICTIVAAIHHTHPDVYNMSLMTAPLLGLYFVSFLVVLASAPGKPQVREAIRRFLLRRTPRRREVVPDHRPVAPARTSAPGGRAGSPRAAAYDDLPRRVRQAQHGDDAKAVDRDNSLRPEEAYGDGVQEVHRDRVDPELPQRQGSSTRSSGDSPNRRSLRSRPRSRAFAARTAATSSS